MRRCLQPRSPSRRAGQNLAAQPGLGTCLQGSAPGPVRRCLWHVVRQPGRSLAGQGGLAAAAVLAVPLQLCHAIRLLASHHVHACSAPLASAATPPRMHAPAPFLRLASLSAGPHGSTQPSTWARLWRSRSPATPHTSWWYAMSRLRLAGWLACWLACMLAAWLASLSSQLACALASMLAYADQPACYFTRMLPSRHACLPACCLSDWQAAEVLVLLLLGLRSLQAAASYVPETGKEAESATAFT